MSTEHTLTVFTPTYNRAYCLERAYKSLCRQTVKDFEWLVIDDGSEDNTKELIDKWISEGIIPIRYIYQDNQGMHGAHNTALRNIDSELNLCLDSDDMLTDDCVDFVLKFWDEHKDEQDRVAGFIALDAYFDGAIIGTRLPDNMEIAHENWLREVWGMWGDKKYVFRTEIAKQAPEYPVFPDEKYGSMGYKMEFIDHLKPWLLANKVIYLVEYQDDGSSRNMYSQYRRALKGWDVARRSSMVHAITFKWRMRACIHYVSNSIFLHKWNFIQDSPKKLLTLFSIPLGIAINILIRLKTYRKKN